MSRNYEREQVAEYACVLIVGFATLVYIYIYIYIYIYTHISTRVRKSAKFERVTYIYSVIICGAGAIMYNDTVKKIYTER
jgi:hypothetical protein